MTVAVGVSWSTSATTFTRTPHLQRHVETEVIIAATVARFIGRHKTTFASGFMLCCGAQIFTRSTKAISSEYIVSRMPSAVRRTLRTQ